MSHCVDNFTVVMSPHRNLLESIKSRILEQVGDKKPMTKNFLDALLSQILFTVVRCCQLSLCLDYVLMWATGSCVLCFSIVSPASIESPGEHPGSAGHKRLTPGHASSRMWPMWPGPADHTWSVTQQLRSALWQHNGPLRDKKAPVTISEQSNCGENLLMRQICTILVFARGNIFLISLNKEIVPCAPVHQSQIIVIISIKIRLHHGFMFSRFSQIS